MSKKLSARDQFVENILKDMSVEQKVGQCFTFLYSGWLITPSIVEAIEKLHAGNLRLQPMYQTGKRHKYYGFDTAGAGYQYPPGYKPAAETLFSPGELGAVTPAEYAEVLNKLQAMATKRPGGIPLNMAVDQEGDINRNYGFCGVSLFPSHMGLAASGDASFIYEAQKAMAKELSAMGITAIHSPVLDVNINPNNPEIGNRAYGDDPQQVAEYALAAMKGLHDGGLIATAKHFPGRGDSMSDAHVDTPTLDAPRQRLYDVELYPYRKLIENGLDCIMLAHNVYTALDPGVIATVSPVIIKKLLREEMGYQGVVTTDSISMAGLMKKFGLPEACARALEAGADMVLNKTETAYRDQGILETLKYVQQGRIPMEELDDKVRRILRMKYKHGMFKKGGQVDPAKADKPIKSPATIELAQQAAQRAAIILKDEDKLLPLTPDKRLLVVEQKLEMIYLGLNTQVHWLNFTEAMLKHSMNIVPADVQLKATPEEEELILDLAKDVDIVVITNFYHRSSETNMALTQKLIDKGYKVVMLTNTPYPMALPKNVKTVLCSFSNTPESHRMAADILFGTKQPLGKWPLKHYQVQ